MPRSMWNELIPRMADGGIRLWGMTPLNVEPYIIDELKNPKMLNKIFLMEMSIWDSCLEDAVRGFRPRKMIQDLVDSYPSEEYEARVSGAFMYFSETIIKVFNYDRHVFEDTDEVVAIDPHRDIIIQSVDPHGGRMPASSWRAFKPNGRVVVFACTSSYDGRTPFWDMKYQTTTLQDLIMWNELEKEFGIKPYRRKIDQRYGFQKNGEKSKALEYAIQSRQAMEDKLMDRAFIFTDSYSVVGKEQEIEYGHDRLRTLLDMTLDDGYPALVIRKSCFHVWNAYLHYVREQPHTQTDRKKAAGTTAIIEKYKDFIDAERYGTCVHVPLEAFKSLEDNTLKESGAVRDELKDNSFRNYAPRQHAARYGKSSNGTTSLMRATIKNR